jgi:hypothetical protein
MRLVLLTALAMAACAATPEGAVIFENHCATCHQTVTGSRTPTRAELGALTPEQVMTALLRGKMTIQGSVLSTSEVRTVARYVTGKNFSAAAVDPAAGRCVGNPSLFLQDRAIGTDGAPTSPTLAISRSRASWRRTRHGSS